MGILDLFRPPQPPKGFRNPPSKPSQPPQSKPNPPAGLFRKYSYLDPDRFKGMVRDTGTRVIGSEQTIREMMDVLWPIIDQKRAGGSVTPPVLKEVKSHLQDMVAFNRTGSSQASKALRVIEELEKSP